jgi:hypothetical protein
MITRFGDRAVSGALRDLSLFEIGTLMRLPSTSNRMNWRLTVSKMPSRDIYQNPI